MKNNLQKLMVLIVIVIQACTCTCFGQEDFENDRLEAVMENIIEWLEDSSHIDTAIKNDINSTLAFEKALGSLINELHLIMSALPESKNKARRILPEDYFVVVNDISKLVGDYEALRPIYTNVRLLEEIQDISSRVKPGFFEKGIYYKTLETVVEIEILLSQKLICLENDNNTTQQLSKINEALSIKSTDLLQIYLKHGEVMIAKLCEKYVRKQSEV